MKFYADLHIHSYYSRATSKHLKLEYLYKWAQLKGIQVLGTGDCIHPGWLKELQEKLEPAEEGFYKLKPEFMAVTEKEVPPSCKAPVRFMLTGEISNIYKRLGKVRKVHNVILLPNFETAEQVQARLEAIGNIRSDGRPILGLDSRDLLEIVLESHPLSYLIPAHIWTPWFSALGSKGGFDRIEDCFGDLTSHVFAVETGLSSDPPMNWRLSQLDPFIMVSNSDAHSPQKLAREATIFDSEFSYRGMYKALSDLNDPGVLGTVEFFPEEGKYHYDGHRKCSTRMHPKESIANQWLCPVCNNPVTVGVVARVEELADRPTGEKPPRWRPFYSLIPLPELIAEAINVGPSSKKTNECFQTMLKKLGNELFILQDASIEEIDASSGPMIAEAIHRMRGGDLNIEAGYDGEYGTIGIFSEAERTSALGQQLELFAEKAPSSLTNHSPVNNVNTPSQVQELTDDPHPLQKEPEVDTPMNPDLPRPSTDIGGLDVSEPSKPYQDKPPKPTKPMDAAEVTTPLQFGKDSQIYTDIPDNVNSAQWQAITHEGSHLLIVAGPGTGKTHTLTYRIARIAQKVGLEHILAITFTNKAAEEMRERLAHKLGMQNSLAGQGDASSRNAIVSNFVGVRSAVTDLTTTLLNRDIPELPISESSKSIEASKKYNETDVIYVGTFHSFCLLFLRQHCNKTDLPTDFVVATPDDIAGLSRTLWPSHTSAQRKTTLAEIAQWKSLGVTNTTPDYIVSYNHALRENGFLDFDDLLLETLALLRHDSGTRSQAHTKYRFLFVDEYQDINAVQHALLKELVQDDVHLTAIGDPNQAIYGFRGSDVRFFRQFGSDFSGAAQFTLNENFRSAGTILEASGQVIQKGDTMEVPELAAKLFVDGHITIHATPTDRAEAEYVVHQVEKLVGGTSMFSQDSGRVETEATAERSFGDFAVLFRLNSQKHALVEAFSRSGIPFQTSSDRPLIAEPGVQEIIALLRIISGQAASIDTVARLLILHVDGFGNVTAESLAEVWRREAAEITLRNIGLLKRSSYSSLSRVLPGIQKFINEAQELKQVYDADGLLVALEHLENLSRWKSLFSVQPKLMENWQRLVRLARLKRDLTEFIDYLHLQRDDDALEMNAEKVSLLTLHASKGLEFPVVFIAGCEENLLPLQHDGLTSSTDEERRLFYVGITRAKERLYFVRANRRHLFGKFIDPGPSPFLADIEEKLKTYEKVVRNHTPKKPERETKQLTLFDDF